jgi:hypothetical protein
MRLTLLVVMALPLQATALLGQHVAAGLAAGPSFTTGGPVEEAGAGWHALAFLGLERTMQPLALRVDLAYSRSPIEADTGTGVVETQRGVSSATANLTYRLPSAGSALSPYVIGGYGLYRADCDEGVACRRATRGGWNAGLGTRVMVGGLRLFAEARYHHSGTAEYVPVSIGFTL